MSSVSLRESAVLCAGEKGQRWGWGVPGGTGEEVAFLGQPAKPALFTLFPFPPACRAQFRVAVFSLGGVVVWAVKLPSFVS